MNQLINATTGLIKYDSAKSYDFCFKLNLLMPAMNFFGINKSVIMLIFDKYIIDRQFVKKSVFNFAN